MTTYLRCTLKPGDPTQLREEDLPALPEWFPLPPKDEQGNPLPAHTQEERARLRRGRAVLEAITGPFDGKTDQVRCDGSGQPPAQLVMVDGRCVYVLDQQQSNKHHASYRYSPQLSLMHPAAMRAVEDGFREYGQDYAMEASHDDTTQLGYSER